MVSLLNYSGRVVSAIVVVWLSSSVSPGLANPIADENSRFTSDSSNSDLTNLTNADPTAPIAAEESLASRSRLWLARGQTLYELGRYPEALSTTEQALILQPNHVAAWELQGDILQKLTRYEEALAAYDQALALLEEQPPAADPTEDLAIATLWTERARVLANLNRYEDSVMSYDRALQLHCRQQRASGVSTSEICQNYGDEPEEPDAATPVDATEGEPVPLW